MVSLPYRIAFLRPQVHAGDSKREHTAALILWVHLFERCVRHPMLAISAPTNVVALDDTFTAREAYTGSAPTWAFDRDRRDEVLWLELSLDEPGRELRLHGLRPGHEGRSSWQCVGGLDDVGGLIDRALALWLVDRDLEPLPGLTVGFSAAQVLAAAAALEPALEAVSSAKGDASDDADADSADADDDADDDDNAIDKATSDKTTSDETTSDESPEPVAMPDLGASPAALKIACTRAFGVCAGRPVFEAVLGLDPENPWALHDAFLANRAHGPVFATLRRALASAPAWGQLHASLVVPGSLATVGLADAPELLEEIGGLGYAALCEPANRASATDYGTRLSRTSRYAERVRLYERIRDGAPYDPSAWLALLPAYEGIEAVGRWRRVAGWGANTVGLVVGGQPQPWNRWSFRVDLHASTALLHAGLLGEAIVLRDNRLEGIESHFRDELAILEGWRKEPRFVAWGYAREGHFRGEDARVLEGFSRAEPQNGVDLGMFIDSLQVCGRGPEALLAWAHLGRGRGLDTPAAHLAAARALLGQQRFTEGFETRLRVQLTCPRQGWYASVERLGRSLAHTPIDALEGFVQAQLQRGAPTLARLAAREIADFVVGASDSSLVSTILGSSEGREGARFDGAWLAGFAGVPSKAAIDGLFAKLDASAHSLADADALVADWPGVRHEGVAKDDHAALAKSTSYVFAQSLARYLRATTSSPSVCAGALRTVACEALLALRHLRDDLDDAGLQAILSAVEAASADVDRWLLDSWVLRIEHELDLEGRSHGRLATLTVDTPAVADLLRGPEGVALETLRAATLLRARPDGFAGEARALLERLVRAAGPSAAGAWAEATLADPDASADQRLDIALTAAWLCVGHDATACVLAAEQLFERDASEDAYEVLCHGLGSWTEKPTREVWRDAQLGRLAPLWQASGIDVPFDFGVGIQDALSALQTGNAARGIRVMRWLMAVDPENAEGQRNLGLGYAMAADVENALVHLALASREQDTQMASGVLYQSGHAPLAMGVLDYACRWYTRAEQWLTFGAIAYQVMDNPRTVQAYANAWELDPDAYDPSNLNSYAGVLDEVGDYPMCERVARRLIEAADGDAMWESNGWHHLACAQIGYGQLEQAVASAQKAIDMNTLPDNEGPFAATLARAHSGERPPVPPPLPPPVPRHDAFVELEQGEIKAVLEHYAKDDSWEARLAVLRASRYRYGSDNYVTVTQNARDAADRVVAATAGASDPLAVLCRSFALEIREQAEYANDPPPMLGDRGTREAFYREFRDRGGIIVGEPPVEAVPFVDREVCPDTALPNASDYVALLRALAEGKPNEVLAERKLDAESFEAAAVAWGQVLRRDAEVQELLAAGLRAGPE